jgi:sensor histidine kinase YesM
VPRARLLSPANTRSYLDWVVGGFYFDFLGYWSAIGVIYAWEYHAESRRRELEAARLDGALRTAELENLRSQLQPHFLFNALQSISTLIHRDPAAADRMLTDLSELLRGSLAHAARQEVPLRDELAFLQRYLDVMRVRLGDRLAVSLDVPDALLDALVPSLLLQPLVENAIRHGIADRAEGGRVTIAARGDGDRLVLEIADDGPGMSAPATGGGIGLSNTRERLGRLYGPAASLATRSTAGRGTTVTLTVPLRKRPA